MTEAITQEQEYVVEVLPETDADVAENPLLGAGTKNLIVEAAEYGIGAMAGFAVSDLLAAKIEHDNAEYFSANPSVWWALPIVKVVGAVALLYGCKKVKSADFKRFLMGFSIGIFADVANDLITAFGVDTSLGITERKIFVQV